MKPPFLWFASSLILLIAMVIVGVVFVTTPSFIKPKLTGNATFRVLSQSLDYASYEIELGTLAELPISFEAKYVPSRPYLLGISINASSTRECEEIAKSSGLNLRLRVTNLGDNSVQEVVADAWVASFPSFAYSVVGPHREPCMLYPRPAGPIELSRFDHYKIEVASNNTITSEIKGARVMLGGQG